RLLLHLVARCTRACPPGRSLSAAGQTASPSVTAACRHALILASGPRPPTHDVVCRRVGCHGTVPREPTQRHTATGLGRQQPGAVAPGRRGCRRAIADVRVCVRPVPGTWTSARGTISKERSAT